MAVCEWDLSSHYCKTNLPLGKNCNLNPSPSTIWKLKAKYHITGVSLPVSTYELEAIFYRFEDKVCRKYAQRLLQSRRNCTQPISNLMKILQPLAIPHHHSLGTNCCPRWQHSPVQSDVYQRLPPEFGVGEDVMACQQLGLNPIEHLWDHLGCAARARVTNTTTLADLQQMLVVEWDVLWWKCGHQHEEKMNPHPMWKHRHQTPGATHPITVYQESSPHVQKDRKEGRERRRAGRWKKPTTATTAATPGPSSPHLQSVVRSVRQVDLRSFIRKERYFKFFSHLIEKL